jgi:hypothetical protein
MPPELVTLRPSEDYSLRTERLEDRWVGGSNPPSYIKRCLHVS